MVHALARELNLPDEALYQDFRAVYARHGSVEYGWAIQEMDAVSKLPDDQIRNLIRIGRGAFRSIRAKRLRPYDGVMETLAWVREQEVKIVAVSNAPLYVAQIRLFQLKLDGLIDGVIGWQGLAAPSGDERFTGEYISNLGPNRKRSRAPWFVALRDEERKPSNVPYLAALEHFGSRADQCWVIGDSIDKDLRPAAEIGAQSIHARYGKAFESKDMDTILQITHWDAFEIKTHYDLSLIEPDYVVDSIRELRSILPTNRPTLF